MNKDIEQDPYQEILRYFAENNECLASGKMCKDCPITDVCNTPEDVNAAKDYLIKKQGVEL